MAKLQKQLDFFEANKELLLKEYAGKILVIPESLQVSVYPSFEEGYQFGIKQYGYGNFLLTECKKKENNIQIVTPIITIL